MEKLLEFKATTKESQNPWRFFYLWTEHFVILTLKDTFCR